MPKRLVLADLDRTLFDTARFVADVWSLAARTYGIDADAERERAPAFYQHYGDWYDYRFFDHLQEVAGARFDAADFAVRARQELDGGYLFSDVTSDTILRIDAIVTFGNPDYQSLKLSLCPQLDGLDRHIILEPKGAYIARAFTRPTVLIDDKQLAGEIKAPSAFIQIDRTGKAAGNDKLVYVIDSFQQLPSILERIDREHPLATD